MPSCALDRYRGLLTVIVAISTYIYEYIPVHEVLVLNQLTVMCTTRGERRLISIECQKECVESKLVISCRMMHNWIKIYHVVQEL